MSGLECEIDIQKTVEEARTCRSGMVQTEEQYKFIYDVIKYYIETQKARIVPQVRHHRTNTFTYTGVPNSDSHHTNDSRTQPEPD